MPPRIPSPFKPGRPALVEPIQQPLYSSVVITAAAPQAQLLFFQATQGAAGQNPTFTNMETAGQLPNPKIFVVEGYRLHVQQNVAVVDGTLANFVGLLQIIESYWYRFFIGVKEYLRVPSHYLNSGLGAWLSAAAAGAEAADEVFYTAQIGVPVHNNYFKIAKRPITIPPQQNFQAELNLGPALAVLTGVDRRVWNYLEGSLGREVM
jgi:hypothetical protein